MLKRRYITPPKKKDENMFETILEKLEALATGRSEDKAKLDAILTQTTQLQGEITNLREQVKKLQEDFQTADKSIIDIQKELEMKADIKDLERLKEEFIRKTDDLENRSKRNNLVFWNVPEGEESGRGCIRLLEDIIVNHLERLKEDIIVNHLERLKEEFIRKTDDLENRSKRNNLVFWNVPEGEESGRGCIRLLEDIIVNHMKLKDTEDIVIEQAHRSGVKKSAKGGKEFSRPIHCRFLHWGDKEYVMKKAPRALKNNPYGAKKATVIVTDDVSKKVREERKYLRHNIFLTC